MANSFNPEQFFKFAAAIVGDVNANEAALRSAISRAYYATFLVSREKLFGLDGVGLTKTTRKKITKKFKLVHGKKREPGTHEIISFAILDKTNKLALSQQLEQLKDARVNADYKLSEDVLLDVSKSSWKAYAEETLQLASQVLPLVKTLPSY
jgi:hypothetical protein